MTTQLTSKETMICGLAIGICNVMTLMEGAPFWADATKEEMMDLLNKLEQIQNEAQ